ncbi:MAG TPA: PEGA domain-containing protein, partial [Kofleriaceae bacterium]|nr:PEGA domain-containing protein [Kofleriaceae bacterium]
MKSFWIVVIVATLSSHARADEREDREIARKEFAAGQAADRRRAWQEAIEHYLRANDLVPHPFAMFNIAVDYERLGKLRDAATWYERYLDSSTPKDADRDKVNRILIDLRNRPAPVQVLSTPDGARVIINGIPSGTTPYKSELAGGMYHVTVQKGDERDSKEITVEYGEPVKVEFTLRHAAPTRSPGASEVRRPAPPTGARGMLFVRGEPYGALITVDNVAIGTLPTSIPLAVGTHTVRITAAGYEPFEQTVAITQSSEVPVDARLSRALGTIPQPAPAAI